MLVDFYKLEPPYMHIVLTDQKAFCACAYKTAFEERSLAVRVVRGNKMLRRDCLFNEFSAAYQFPDYFGENWDALEECLADIEWLPAKGYVLFVANTTEVLSQEQNEQFEIFAKVLSRTCEEWARTQTPKPFHILFQCVNSELDHLRQRFQSAGVNVPLGNFAA